MKFLLGIKQSMTQRYDADGNVHAVTRVQAGPCIVTQVKTAPKDAATAVQIGFGKRRLLRKPLIGHLKGLPSFRYLREFRVDSTDGIERGKEMTVAMFQPGDVVHITATSKGKGFQGVVKRHGFHGSPATHGHKDQLRMPGSIGSTDPARVFKGMRMAGRMGGDRVTVHNLTVQTVDPATNTIEITGAIPGAVNGLVMITGEGALAFSDVQDVKQQTETNEPEAQEVLKEETSADERPSEKSNDIHEG